MLKKSGIVLALSIFIVTFAYVVLSYQTSNEQLVRNVALEREVLDSQAILNGFDDAEFNIEGNMAKFAGYQQIDLAMLSLIDDVSLTPEESRELEKYGNVRFQFTYDVESNIVTIEAKLHLPSGEIIIDRLYGVGFYNQNDEIDAVIYIDGDGILLSEMRNTGMIDNVWFRNLVQSVARAAATVAVGAVVAAAVVATAGLAAPALMAAGVGIISASAVAAVTILTKTAFTAAIVAGIALTADLIAANFPDITVRTRNVNGVDQPIIDSSNPRNHARVKELVKDITLAEEKRNPNITTGVFFEVLEIHMNFPREISVVPLTQEQMVKFILNSGSSSITLRRMNAESVITKALPGFPIFPESNGLRHFHAADINHPNFNQNRDLHANPRVYLHGRSIHSFWVV